MNNNKDEKFATITPKIVLGQLFKSRNVMTLVHLRTHSLAIHKTSEEYYESLSKILDKLAEVHFGAIGKKEIDDIPHAKYVDPEMHLKDISHYLQTNRGVFLTSAEQSIIDELLALMFHSLYKLTLL